MAILESPQFVLRIDHFIQFLNIFIPRGFSRESILLLAADRNM